MDSTMENVVVATTLIAYFAIYGFIFLALIGGIIAALVVSSKEPKPKTYQQVMAENAQMGPYQGPVPNELLENVSIAMNVILTLVTGGIYGWVWVHAINKKIRVLCGESTKCLGETLMVLFIPYYSYYWAYTRGKKLFHGFERFSFRTSDSSIVYLLLCIFGLQVVAYALIQNDLNSFAGMRMGLPRA